MRPLLLGLLIISACAQQSDSRSNQSKPLRPTNQLQPDTSLNGMYVGLEEMCDTDTNGVKDCFSDPSRPSRKWYHLSYLKIKNDSAYLDQNPINIGSHNDTLWSSADGGYYYYSGLVKKKDSVISISLTERFCDYCGVPVKTKPDGSKERVFRKKVFRGQTKGNGLFLNGYFFHPTTEKVDLMSETPKRYIDLGL